MPAESLNLKPTDTYRATDTQVLRRRFIGHTVFSQYTFLWSLSSTEKQGVALVIKRQFMTVQPPPVVSYTLHDAETDKVNGGREMVGQKISDNRVIKVSVCVAVCLPVHLFYTVGE